MYFAPGISNRELADRDDCMGIGATSNYPWTEEAMLFWIKQIPKDKLVMALPAYSNDYTVSENIKGRQIYQSVPDRVKGVLPAPRWLWYEKVNSYLYDGADGNKHLFYAADARSTEALLELADKLEIHKIGFWHFSSVSPEMWKVVEKWVKNSNFIENN
jgi:spore germination protein YaaH